MDLTAFIFSFLAGVLSTLSPCVLPILPIIVSSALQEQLKGLLALVFGLSLSFAITGTLLSYSAMLWDFDISSIKTFSAGLLLLFGLIIIFDKLNEKFVAFASILTNKGNQKLSGFKASGTVGQFMLGALLGFVWTPCVGPTLGAAISFAIQGENMFSAFVTMLIFGIGAGLPLLFIAMMSGKLLNRQKIAVNAVRMKKAMGAFLIVISVGIFTGYDKVVETYLIEISPDWLTTLTTTI